MAFIILNQVAESSSETDQEAKSSKIQRNGANGLKISLTSAKFMVKLMHCWLDFWYTSA